MIRPIDIAYRFAPMVSSLEPIGNGLINDTFLVRTPDNDFVLQKINRRVFPHPELIMLNLSLLNQHINQINHTEDSLAIPALLQSEDGSLFYRDVEDDYWRAWSYVANTDCLESFRNLDDAEQVGAALGKFHRLCHGLDSGLFHDTLPGFHITPGYLARYMEARSNSCISEDGFCSQFVDDNLHMVNDLEDAKAQGLLIERIIHGDPKLNNFLFDKNSKKVISLIDLDTIKPGLIHYDIGDSLRSCCHIETANTFDLAICRAVLSSYIKEMAGLLTAADFDFLYPAIRLIPFELGLRFYTDHLEGNRYFKVSEPGQNLARAKAQFLLCANIIALESTIKTMISEIA